jgi:hypothetical protein
LDSSGLRNPLYSPAVVEDAAVVIGACNTEIVAVVAMVVENVVAVVSTAVVELVLVYVVVVVPEGTMAVVALGDVVEDVVVTVTRTVSCS